MKKNVIRLVAAMLMLSLPCCYNLKQVKQEEEQVNDTSSSDMSSKTNAVEEKTKTLSDVTGTRSLRNIRESKYRLTTEDIIAHELKTAMDEFERGFKIPSGGCALWKNVSGV